MKCSNPFVLKSQALPCGQCLACRINRRRLWCHRIQLEMLNHSLNSFVTLTYSDENLPRTPKRPSYTLSPPHLRNFLKRLRHISDPVKLRYYAVGEYGDETQRPHYHLALFGYSGCTWGKSRYSRTKLQCCTPCDTVRDAWGLGHIFIGELNQQSAQYVAGYVVKKMTQPTDTRLNGRYPEFCRMSLRPGIGAHIIDDYASTLLELDYTEIDVPSGLRHGSKIWPIGRYLKRRLRSRIGLSPETPQLAKDQTFNEMQPLRQYAFDNSTSLASVVKQVYEGQTSQLEGRFKAKKGNV